MFKVISEIQYRHVPRGPEQVADAIWRAKEELSPDRPAIPGGALEHPLSYTRALIVDLRAMLAEDVTLAGIPVETHSDYAWITGSRDVSDMARLAAKALCSLIELNETAQSFALNQIGAGEPRFENWPTWRELRENLVELGAWLLDHELFEQEQRADGAMKLAAKGKPLVERMGKTPLLPKTILYLKTCKADTDQKKRGRNIRAARAIAFAAPMNDDSTSPFFRRNHGALIDRTTDQPITEDQMVIQIQRAIADENKRVRKASKEGRRPSQK